jgi:hypothetical protein
MSIKFKRTGDGDYPRTIKALIMGPPKSGKTSFVATAPNVLVASCESGLMSIAHRDIAYVDINSWADIESLYLVLNDDSMRKRAIKQLQVQGIDTIAIDTLDALQELLKRQILEEVGKDQMRKQDWGTLKERFAAMLKAFVALPMNVIFTVHMGHSTDSDDNVIYGPLLQGSIQNEVAGYVDFSLMTGRRKITSIDGVTRVEYYLRNEGDQEYPHLGNRGAQRIPYESEPDFNNLHDLVFEAIDSIPRSQEIIVDDTVEVVPEIPGQTTIEEQIEEVAENVSQPEVDEPKEPELITPAGITALTKSYKEANLSLPVDLEAWTIDKARDVAKTFARNKKNVATGGDPRDLVIQLINQAAFGGEKEVAAPAPAAEIIKEKLGGTVIGVEILEGAACADCGKTVDDLEVAQLGQTRYKRPLCIACFKSVQQEEKE